MDSMLKQPRNVLLFFMPDYVLKSMKAQGVHLTDLVDLMRHNSDHNGNNKDYHCLKDRFDTVSVDNLKNKLSDSLSKQDYDDLWISNIIGASLLNSKPNITMWDKTLLVTQASSLIAKSLLYFRSEDYSPITRNINETMLREFVSSMVDNSHPILEKSMEESNLVQFEVVDDILFVVFKKGFFNLSFSSFFSFRNLFLSTLLISLFRFFPEEEVYNSKVFSSILRIFYKQ